MLCGSENGRRNVSLPGLLKLMDARSDMVVLAVTTIAVVTFLLYVIFGPSN